MKRLPLLFALLTLTFFANADSLRTQIETMNKKVNASMMNRDIDGFTSALKGGVTPDFKYSEAGKSMSYKQMVATMKQGMDMLTKMTSVTTKILSLKEMGDLARCTTYNSSVGTMVDGKKKAHKVAFTGTSVMTYRKTRGKWMLASMSWSNQKMTMDGKPFTGQ